MNANALPITISFFVAGVPIPEGSTKGFYNEKAKRVIITHDNPTLDQWRQRIATEAQHEAKGTFFIAKNDGVNDGVEVRMRFLLPRPKSAKKGARPTKRPDVDKISRSGLDALTDVLFEDDSQVLVLIARKVYQDADKAPGVLITVTTEVSD